MTRLLVSTWFLPFYSQPGRRVWASAASWSRCRVMCAAATPRGWIGRNQSESPNMKQHTRVPDSRCSRLAGALGLFFYFICMRDFGLWCTRHEMRPCEWVVSAFSSPRFPSPPRPPSSSALTRLAWCPASVYFSVTQTVNPIHEASPSASCSTASFRTELGLRVALLQPLVACAAAFGDTGLSA